MPDGRAIQTHIVAENNRVASRASGRHITASGRLRNFTTLDFFASRTDSSPKRLGERRLVRAYQSFGLLPEEVTQ